MEETMEKEMIYHPLFILVLVVLSFMLLVCLIRAVKGPRVADRLMAVNMMGTMVMVMISVLALLFQESYLVDICLIYRFSEPSLRLLIYFIFN